MIELGLARVHRLLARTPLTWRAIHVAGTNGKGSICAYISNMLDQYNASDMRQGQMEPPLTYGRFTSPHLVDRWDCVSINGDTISENIFKRIEAAVLERNEAESVGASEFEILTATAFEIFNEANVHVGIIEVGMGGRLDATNVIGQASIYDKNHELGMEAVEFRPPPLVTIISSIGLDHQGFLGNTVEVIAREKAGILKRGVPAIVADEDVNVSDAIADRASAAGTSQLIFVSTDTSARDVFSRTPQGALAKYQQGLNVPIQTRWPNGALAVEATWQALGRLGRLQTATLAHSSDLLMTFARVPDTTLWPGRLQTISLKPITGYEGLVILDGAHNAQSAAALAKYVGELSGQRSVQWVLAASEGKDIEQLLSILVRDGDAVSAVEFSPVDGMPWVKPMSSAAIVEAVERSQPGSHRHHGTDVLDALRHASKEAERHDRQVAIAGSLYLVGDVFRCLRKDGPL